MNRLDKEKIIHLYQEQIGVGIPVDVCYGTGKEQQEWLMKKLTFTLDSVIAFGDDPIGTKDDGKYLHCSACNKVVGTSGSFCKWCGAKLREKES